MSRLVPAIPPAPPVRAPRKGAAPPAPKAASPIITILQVEQTRRARFDPLPNLTPQGLVTYLQQFGYGYLGMASRTWDAMERRDDRLMAVVPKAKSALARYGYEIVTPDNLRDGQKAEAAAHKEALEFFYGNLEAINAIDENETGGFSLFARQKADAIGKRYSVHEVIWQPLSDGLTAQVRHAPLWFFENITGRLRFLPLDGAGEGIQMNPLAWHVSAGPGLMEACSVLYLYKHFPLQDWLGYSEKFGFPAVLGKTDAAIGTPEFQAMQAAVASFGNDFGAVVNAGDSLELIERRGGGDKTPFEGLIERSDRAMSILWRGADLGTQSHQGGGQGQGASLQQDETDKLDSDRAAWLAESLIGLSRQVIAFQFGAGVRPLAYLRIKTEVKKDVQLEVAVDTFLLTNGAPLAVDDVLERFGRQRPPKDAELLKAPAAAGAETAKEDQTEATITKAINEARAIVIDKGDAAAAKLQAETLRQVGAALKADRAAINNRLEQIAAIDDLDLRKAALNKLRRDLPELLKAINADPAAGRVLAAGMVPAFFNGIAEGEMQTPEGLTQQL